MQLNLSKGVMWLQQWCAKDRRQAERLREEGGLALDLTVN